eukprot:SAG11_NODE_3771_length_2236_cov_2.717829_2_plen_69_part_00
MMTRMKMKINGVLAGEAAVLRVGHSCKENLSKNLEWPPLGENPSREQSQDSESLVCVSGESLRIAVPG